MEVKKVPVALIRPVNKDYNQVVKMMNTAEITTESITLFFECAVNFTENNWWVNHDHFSEVMELAAVKLITIDDVKFVETDLPF